MFRATMCPSSGADDCVVLSPRVDVVPWLQEGCQNQLAGSVSIEEFVAQLRSPQWTNYLRTGFDNFTAATGMHFNLLTHWTTPAHNNETTTHYTPHNNHTQPDHTRFTINQTNTEHIDPNRQTDLNNTTHCYSTMPTRGDNTNQSSAPKDGHMVARNMLSNS